MILYNAHLDTNEVADESEWPRPPLEPVVEGDMMFGLGASDCKGGVAAIVYGAAILAQVRARLTFEVFGNLVGLDSLIIMGATLEEDAEGFALRSLVERDGLRPDVVLLAEVDYRPDLAPRAAGTLQGARPRRGPGGPCGPAALWRERHP